MTYKHVRKDQNALIQLIPNMTSKKQKIPKIFEMLKEQYDTMIYKNIINQSNILLYICNLPKYILQLYIQKQSYMYIYTAYRYNTCWRDILERGGTGKRGHPITLRRTFMSGFLWKTMECNCVFIHFFHDFDFVDLPPLSSSCSSSSIGSSINGANLCIIISFSFLLSFFLFFLFVLGSFFLSLCAYAAAYSLSAFCSPFVFFVC